MASTSFDKEEFELNRNAEKAQEQIRKSSDESDSPPKSYTDDDEYQDKELADDESAKASITSDFETVASRTTESVNTENSRISKEQGTSTENGAGSTRHQHLAHTNPYQYQNAQLPFDATQYTGGQYPYYQPASAVDPDQEYYMQYYSQQVALSAPTPGMSYEMRRSQNQMSHYFDTSKYPVNMPVPLVQGGAAPKKVTKKDIERFKKRKEEKKRIKNKWLFE